jgi:tRNA pseudouridine(55) synthase
MSEERIILVDKPVGWTSNDVVRFLKGKLQPCKVGHAGTLDPFATGLLLVLVGSATKKFSELLNLKKEYEMEVCFGEERDTDDITGEVVSQYRGEVLLGRDIIEKVLSEHFLGKIIQTPPKYSAIKIGGKRAYDLSRKKKSFIVPRREVEIYESDVLEVTQESFVIPAGKTQEIIKTFSSKGYVAPFILVSAYDETTEVKSQLNIRYSDNKKGVRAHYLGATKFPLKEGERAQVYTCFHALNETGYGDGQVKVELRGYDRGGREIFSKEEMTSSTNVPKQGLAYTLQTTRDVTYLKLESVITAGGVMYSATTTYDCLITSNCPELKYKGTDLYKEANKERSGTFPFLVGILATVLFIFISVTTVCFLRKKMFKDSENEKEINN